MSVSVASKNIYEALGNDPPEDEQPSKAPRQVIKNVTTSKKRDEKLAPDVAGAGAGARGGRRGGRAGFTGNDAAFHDRDAGRDNNRAKSADGAEAPSRGGGARRGGARRGREFDRHSGTGRDEHEKQAEHGWGANKGESEWNDEIAGQELANKDAAGVDTADPNAVTTDAAEAEAAAAAAEEEKTKTYDEYLAELAARQANLGPPVAVRRPNEGTREDKKWANAKPLEKEGGEDYFAGDAKDKTRTRERKTKNLLDIEPQFVEPRDQRRGGGRGGRGRGDRGRGDGAPRGRGDRGAPRGSAYHGGRQQAPSRAYIKDDSAFPALGA